VRVLLSQPTGRIEASDFVRDAVLLGRKPRELALDLGLLGSSRRQQGVEAPAQAL